MNNAIGGGGGGALHSFFKVTFLVFNYYGPPRGPTLILYFYSPT